MDLKKHMIIGSATKPFFTENQDRTDPGFWKREKFDDDDYPIISLRYWLANSKINQKALF